MVLGGKSSSSPSFSGKLITVRLHTEALSEFLASQLMVLANRILICRQCREPPWPWSAQNSGDTRDTSIYYGQRGLGTRRVGRNPLHYACRGWEDWWAYMEHGGEVMPYWDYSPEKTKYKYRIRVGGAKSAAGWIAAGQHGAAAGRADGRGHVEIREPLRNNRTAGA